MGGDNEITRRLCVAYAFKLTNAQLQFNVSQVQDKVYRNYGVILKLKHVMLMFDIGCLSGYCISSSWFNLIHEYLP